MELQSIIIIIIFIIIIIIIIIVVVVVLQSIIVITNILRYTHAHKQLYNRYSSLSRWYAYINWQIQLYSSAF